MARRLTKVKALEGIGEGRDAWSAPSIFITKRS